ncbi:MAG: DUF7146 domain-containing protein [Rhizomicrobium sp.]
MRAGEIAKALGGEFRGRYVYAPGPRHSRKDRSLWLLLDHQAPDGFLVGSFSGENWKEIKDYVRDRLGIEREASARAIRHAPPRPKIDEANDNRQRALEIAKASQPIDGTLAEQYLTKRIGRRIDWPSCLRFHPQCPRGSERLPALIAIMRDAQTNEFRCIQRVFLKPDGTDRLRDAHGKMTLGSAAGACCKLSCNADVTTGLGLCEGIEKALAIIAMGWSPVWSTCGASGMTNFPILQGIEALTIFADNDEAGQRAAKSCAERWADAGREAIVRTPMIGGDWGDALEGAR